MSDPSTISTRSYAQLAYEREKLIRNEQTKLLANAIDRASTAVGVSSLLPLWQLSAGGGDDHVIIFAVSAYIFINSAFVLHWIARRVLRGLR